MGSIPRQLTFWVLTVLLICLENLNEKKLKNVNLNGRRRRRRGRNSFFFSPGDGWKVEPKESSTSSRPVLELERAPPVVGPWDCGLPLLSALCDRTQCDGGAWNPIYMKPRQTTFQTLSSPTSCFTCFHSSPCTLSLFLFFLSVSLFLSSFFLSHSLYVFLTVSFTHIS